jgi:hypothetical protein
MIQRDAFLSHGDKLECKLLNLIIFKTMTFSSLLHGSFFRPSDNVTAVDHAQAEASLAFKILLAGACIM